MKTPSPVKCEGAERYFSGDRTLSNSLSNSQHLSAGNDPAIVVDDCRVRIVGGPNEIGVPRRKGFAWASNARDCAERLNIERGWPVEASRAS